MSDEMGELVLVRHSVVNIDPAVPSHLWKLSREGRSRCLRLATHLLHHQPTLYVASREPKAMETGRILAEYGGVPWKTAENLHEHDRRGTGHYENLEKFQQAVVRLFRHPNELVFGRETAVQARERFEKAIRGVLEEHPSERIGIVAHGTVITLLLCRYNPALQAIPFWQSLTFPCYFTVSLPEFTLRARQEIN